MTTNSSALNRLSLGNKRFVAGQRYSGSATPQRRLQLTDAQAPFAVVVGCSDSRVPVELVFDQGLGDLFVIRVAGNIVDEAVAGSVEFAVSKFGCELVVVLGHSSCGAINATLSEINQPSENLSSNLQFIVDSIEPSLGSLLEEKSKLAEEVLIGRAVKANVLQSTRKLYQNSDILKMSVNDRKLAILGAVYDLSSGEVEFFDRIPA